MSSEKGGNESMFHKRPRREGSFRERAEELTEALRDAGHAAREKLEQLKGALGEYYEQGVKTTQEAEHRLEDYVREKPLRSILMAAGVGALLVWFWRR
jgi:ElaB/YqjD/DUF883 family membrane-anchored ribosome-binding protein